MADEKPKTVEVEALKYHTYMGEEYNVGDTYDIEEQYADSVLAQGMAARTDRVQVARQQQRAAEKTAQQRDSQETRAGSNRAKGATKKTRRARKASK